MVFSSSAFRFFSRLSNGRGRVTLILLRISCRRLVVQLSGPPSSLRDCLLALPCLHTLCITSSSIVTCEIQEAFKYRPDFPEIKTLAIPISAHPILPRIPKVEEFIYFAGQKRSPKVVLGKFRGPYTRERNGDVDPVLKSFTIMAPSLNPISYPSMFAALSLLTAPHPFVFCRIGREVPKTTQSFVANGQFSFSTHRSRR